MNVRTAWSRTHDGPAGRPPTRNPVGEIRAGIRRKKGRSVPAGQENASSRYQVVLHCTYEAKTH